MFQVIQMRNKEIMDVQSCFLSTTLQMWCYCGHVVKSRTMKHLNFDCQSNLSKSHKGLVIMTPCTQRLKMSIKIPERANCIHFLLISLRSFMFNVLICCFLFCNGSFQFSFIFTKITFLTVSLQTDTVRRYKL